ncbi:interleukin-1 receptor accessory protein-like 1-A [Cloeon dipterum]|uniref:interleukin-1 receptor accessory protein-like 1-A n=1 Tax=Cloeon dipterum TaxID=197152 RepID=UPI00321FCB3D
MMGLCKVALVLTLLLGPVLAQDNKQEFCTKFHLSATHNASGMQFTREVGQSDFAIEAKFKSIHCCARGYRSIEWYKDDIPYPWLGLGGGSSFILDPQAVNQTIFSAAVRESDAGLYKCVVRNDTHAFSHKINLTVLDNDYDGPMRTTYKPDDQYILPGDSTRFFCEAFIGQINSNKTSDLYQSVIWKKQGENSTLQNTTRFMQHHFHRDEDQTLGGYLEISNVQLSDYGRYICSISVFNRNTHVMVALHKQEVPKAAPLTSPANGVLSLAVALSCTILVLVVLIYYKLRLRLLLLWKDFFSSGDKNDPKEFDIFICYVTKDAEFAVSELLPALEKRFHYQCCIHQLQPDGCGRLSQLSQVSRRLVMVLSPALAQQHSSTWSAASLAQLLDHLSQLHPSVVFVVTQELPVDTPGGELAAALKNTRHIIWPTQAKLEKDGTNFWIRLCLLLPARRPLCAPRARDRPPAKTQLPANNDLQMKKLNPATSTSRESLEVLV